MTSTSSHSLARFMPACQQRVNGLLKQQLKQREPLSTYLQRAIDYAVLSSGKRIRPILLYATAETLQLPWHKFDAAACAIECVHASSLVHDDLPAMDNDEFRRGQLTCHKAFDEATAILVGDALQFLAFEILAQATTVPADQRMTWVNILAQAAGAGGMVGGQALDLAACGQKLNQHQLEHIHQHKTGALLVACVEFVLTLYQGPTTTCVALRDYARAIGLAFQIQDDVLDTGSIAQQSWVPCYSQQLSVAHAKQLLQQLYQQAMTALQPLEHNAHILRQLAEFIICRTY